MALKLILFSVTGTLADASHKLDRNIIGEFVQLLRDLRGNGVNAALWTTKPWNLKNGTKLEDYLSEKVGFSIPAFGPLRGGFAARRLGNAVGPILEHFQVKPYEAILVGGTDDDMRAGVNSGLLHIRPTWYASQTDYGFPVASVSELARFCFVFALRQHPIYFRAPPGDPKFSAAGPFTTMHAAHAQFGVDAKNAAKFGQGHPDFWFSLCTSTLYFSGMLEGVKYMCVYPGHKGHGTVDSEDSMEAALTRLGRCFNISFYHDLIQRHTNAPKSQHTKAAERSFRTQLETIKLEQKPHRNLDPEPRKTKIDLKGKRVLVVDDICTSGRSLEAARAFLEAAGAEVRLFAWLKTINSAYCVLAEKLKFDPFAPSVFAEPKAAFCSYDGGIVDADAATELSQVFKRYTEWA